MKKQLCIILSLLMMLSVLSKKSYAVYGDDIREMTNEDGSITKVYKKAVIHGLTEKQNGTLQMEDHSEIKKILSELGMEDDFINKLTEEDLAFYENSSSIVGKTSYIKIDAEGNSHVISEYDALNAVEELESRDIDQSTYGSHEQDIYQDEYMRVFHMVSQWRDTPEFRFVTDARWLRMPAFRRTDSIGSCAQSISIIPRSERGWYDFERRTNYTHGWEKDGDFIRSRDISRDSHGTFNGAAAEIDLPNDYFGNYSFEEYRDFKAHFQFDAEMIYPNSSTIFDSIGTYDHIVYHIGFFPSISIGFKGGSMSIGFDISYGHDRRNVELQLYYQR